MKCICDWNLKHIEDKCALWKTVKPVFTNKIPRSRVVTDNCLTWESQISAVQRKISRAIGLLKYARDFVQTGTLINIYKSIIGPHFS